MEFAKEALKYGGRLNLVNNGVFKKYGVGNTTLESFNGKIYVSYRVGCYTFLSIRNKITYNAKTLWMPNLGEFPECTFGCTNVVGVLNKETLEVENQIEYFSDINRGKNVYTGYEDIRLINWNNKLYAIASKPYAFENNKIPICIVELNNSLGIEKEMCYCINDIEKNWMPVEHQPMTFLYSSVNPTNVTVCDWNGNVYLKKKKETNESVFYKGSSQVREYKDHYVVLTHVSNNTICDDMNLYRYYHVFLIYDKEWNLVGKSNLFTFMGYSIEFSNGFLIEDDDVYITFSIYDNISFVIKTNTVFLDYIIGFGKKPNVLKEKKDIGINFPKNDKERFLLCKIIEKRENYNGAFALFTSIAAFTKDINWQKKHTQKLFCY